MPLGVLWSISTLVDYDIANQFVTSAYDRSLLDSAIDIGKQIKVQEGRIQADLPEVVLEMLITGEPGQFYYLITGPARRVHRRAQGPAAAARSRRRQGHLLRRGVPRASR